MRSSYDSSQRERSRQRATRDGYSNPRDVSPDMDPYHRPYSTHQFAKKKRVKFNDQEDIRVFKKEDQPIAKNLTQDDIFQLKQQIEKEISRTYDFNWDQKKHFDALSEQNSMKEQKEKQKELYEKLMGMKEEMQFYTPYALAIPKDNGTPEAGSESIEKQAHAQRTRDVLGCYYTQINEIPNEPIFEVASQCNKNEPKVIRFNPGGINEAETFATSKNKNQKQLKGILKMPGENIRKSTSAPRQVQEREISPRLLWLLKQLQVNKQKYNKEMTQLLLKPYKDSGQLQYWMSNQELLNEKLKNQPVGVAPPPSNLPVVAQIPRPQMQPFQPMGRMSPSPSNEFRPQFNQPYEPNPQLKADKFKTVPCKYFHSHQGCVKTENCTFIHDQRYRGVPHPMMIRQQQQFQQYPGGGGFENRGGFQDNPGYQRRDNFQPYNSYQNPQSGGQYGGFKPQFNKPYGNQPGQFQQGGYNPQARYQNYPPQQGGGQMSPSNYPPMGQQQMQNPNYPGYTNPQQQQMPPSMYYGQGQGGNMQQRNETQR